MTPETFAEWDGSTDLPDLVYADVLCEAANRVVVACLRFPEGTGYEVTHTAAASTLDLEMAMAEVTGDFLSGVNARYPGTGEPARRWVFWAKDLTADAILWNRTAKGADERHTADAERQSV